MGELYLQGMVIPHMKTSSHAHAMSDSLSNKSLSANHDHTRIQNATVSFLQSSSAIKQLQNDLYMAPGPSTLVLLSSLHDDANDKKDTQNQNAPTSFWWIRQTAMPHKF